MLVLKIQLLTCILVSCAIATSAKLNVPSSRQVFRSGGRTLKGPPPPKDLPRECSYKSDDKNETLVFACQSEKDTLWYSLDSTNNAKIDLIVKKGKKSSQFPSKGGKDSLGVRFLKLVEYVPNTTAPAYDFEATELSSYSLDKFDKFTTPSKTNGIYKTSLQTKDKVVTFNYYITENGSKTGLGLSQHKLKYDIIIEGYNWKQQEGSLLALLAEVDTPSGKGKSKKKKYGGTDTYVTEQVDAGLELEEQSTDFSIFGEYTWVSEAEAKNGTKLGITATQPADQKDNAKKQTIAFTFLESSGEEKITWDPEVGIGYGDSTSGVESLFKFGSVKQLMVGAFFSLAYFW